ncbi:hypothetical protein [Pseudomonas ficuserectae]|uniref:hypothetical protein n=1 Tax=Pseudomonas ficuserectae TaxID=53410 RepID=UPI0006E68AFD|nr:hypothetical protein [Pseudomonas ficuserectae]KPX50476.1 hypothetical protein ALO69_200070 [Pseudomonas ficuserectae]RMS30701.1 hypothetical protein ALP68_200134 [Pseudomonas ficuserectae]RMS38248.1 hypothetical protein ALP67_200040 [Pseudomonas ficuserectae]
MQDFIDIDDAIIVSLDEYVDSISDSSYRGRVLDVFNNVRECLDRLSRRAGRTVGVPDIRVKLSDKKTAEANPLGSIVLTRGIIDHCLSLKTPAFQERPEDPALFALDPDLAAMLGMAWIVSHEYAHLYRAHHAVEAFLGSEVYVLRAFEHDADLVAAAAVFRQLQSIVGFLFPDIQVRQCTLSSIYWIVRTLPDTHDRTGVHPPFSERFFQILLKLVTVVTDGSEIYDPDCLRPETQVRRELLIKTAVACEKAHKGCNDRSSKGYFSEWQDYIERNGHTDIIYDWMKVSPHVERFSGTIADMSRQNPYRGKIL